MSKAKANTQEQSGLALAKQAELEATRKREAQIEKQNAAREKERRLKEQEARRKREQERLALEEKLRKEREEKRALKVSRRLQSHCCYLCLRMYPFQDKESKDAPAQTAAHVAKKGGKVPSTTERIPSAASTPKVVSVALKKKRRIDAMFSDDEGTSDASSSRKAGSSKHRTSGVAEKVARGSSGLASARDTLSAKEKLKRGFDPSELRSLNENRKDVRTIEEIEQDYRRKQALAQPPHSALPSNGLFANRKTASSVPPSTPSSSTVTTTAQASHASQKPSSAASEAPGKPVQSSSKAKNITVDAAPRKRTASPSNPTSSRQPARSRSPPPRKRAASPTSSPPAKLSKTEARRQEIWAILNPHKAQAPAFGASYVDDLSDDDDMEAGIDDIEEEDRRAARIARLEDRKEEERLKQRAREKAAKKNAKG